MATTVRHLSSIAYSVASRCRTHHLPTTFIRPMSSVTLRVRTLTPLSTTTTTTTLRSRRLISSTTTGASAPHHVNDPGSIDSSLMQSMQSKIKDELNAESVIVKDAYGDGRHVSIVVVSTAFEGQSAVNRQRMVYKAIWAELQSTVHAVDQMITQTPSEAAKPSETRY